MPKDITPSTVEEATALAAEIKSTLTKVEEALAEGNLTKAQRALNIHHHKLNDAATALADLFEVDVTVMSGGGDKPPQEP